MRTILLATGNPGKAREMREIIEGLDTDAASAGRPGDAPHLRWAYLSDFADRDWPEPVESGETFVTNAEIKARHYARLSGLWTIADDSGLVVDALGGEPGVRSARYAGEPKDDGANNALLVCNLASVPAARRTARFRCVVVLAGVRNAAETPADPHAHTSERRGLSPPELAIDVLASAEGTVEGVIVDEARGTNGFGYDPHFFVPSHGKTMAELSPEAKHAISHRGQALRRLRGQVAALLG